MERYLTQLLADLRAIARGRQGQVGAPADHYSRNEAGLPAVDYATYRAELDRFFYGEGAGSMYRAIGLLPEAFPPADRLSDPQLRALVFQILDVWTAHRIIPTVPAGIAPRLLYPELLRIMHDDFDDPGDDGWVQQEFCHFLPEECPWSSEFCTCRRLEEEDGE
ncbi:hypothetical protein [Neolewinella litorea]|uniref:Uncharacterized protein n=1 Tax=Neolewinella litorea TaxID=2562452 RepID=A0A4S4NGW1_9BACT|nr:hypothetical protein [Neolewinella litorea]THH37897.1 hypothetical protein E4021_12730 [Neolewinella litorea]